MPATCTREPAWWWIRSIRRRWATRWRKTAGILRGKPFSEYFTRVFAPYYLKHRPNSTRDSLIADNRLDVIGDALRNDPDYYVQTNSDDLILDQARIGVAKTTLGSRIAVYDHGGHLGNLGDAQQVADMLDMLAGRWAGGGDESCARAWPDVAGADVLAGCASDGVIIHRLPAETPAADNAAAIGKATKSRPLRRAAEKVQEPPQAQARTTRVSRAEAAPPLTPADAPAMTTYDPWERLNRFNYRFNARFDEAIFLPVANGY